MNEENVEKIVEQAVKVSWKNIKDRNGFIEYDVPSLLRNLVNIEIEKREESYWSLDNNIVIQSGLSESCLFVLPFLNELVKIAEYKDRLLDLIFEILNGSDFTTDGYVNVQFREVGSPFLHYQLDKKVKPLQLKPCIINYIEKSTNVYCNILSTENKKELETVLYILLCLRPSEFIRESFYEAKNNQVDNLLSEVFNDFIEDIEEIHGLTSNT